MKPQETKVKDAVANQCQVSEGRCCVRIFDLNHAEGRVLYAIDRMMAAQKISDVSEKGKKEAEIMKDYKHHLKEILNLDNRDCEALTVYALTKGQERMLIPVFERMGDGIVNMRFDLPTCDLTKKDPMAVDLPQYKAGEKSSGNTLLQLFAYYGKLNALPSLGVSEQAIEQMKTIKPTKRTNDKQQPVFIRRIGKGFSY